jgi:hypothetical protein
MDGDEARALTADPDLAGVGNRCGGDGFAPYRALACSSQRLARRYWFGPFATVLPSILFHMIWTTMGVTSVAIATVKAKRQRLSMGHLPLRELVSSAAGVPA